MKQLTLKKCHSGWSFIGGGSSRGINLSSDSFINTVLSYSVTWKQGNTVVLWKGREDQTPDLRRPYYSTVPNYLVFRHLNVTEGSLVQISF